MSKIFIDGNGELQIENHNGRTFPVYNESGDKFLWTKPDGITPVYNSLSKPTDSLNPATMQPIDNGSLRYHEHDILNILPEVKGRLI